MHLNVRMKEIISSNMRKALKAKQKSFSGTRCEHCGQCLPNYTQEWVGEQIGVSKATIVHYFQGNRLPSIERLYSIAVALEVGLATLLQGLDEIEYSDRRQQWEM